MGLEGAVRLGFKKELDVIDPVETERWIMRGLRSMSEPDRRSGKKRPNIDCR